MNIVTIQDSFEESINDDEKFWVAIRKHDENQQLFHINSESNPIEFKKNGNRYQFIYNNETYKLIKGQCIELKDISSVSKLGNNLIIGTKSGSLIIYDLATKEKKLFNDCHYLDIEEIQILPSKEVILTRGFDHQIKLWSVKYWKELRTMKSGFSTNVESIGKGRNFVVGNKYDVELWECGSGELVYKFSKVRNKEDVVSYIKVISSGSEQVPESSGSKGNPKEFELEGKSLLVGYESGELRKFDLTTKNSELVYQFDSSILQIEVINNTLIIGLKGEIILFNEGIKFRKPLNPDIVKFKFNDHYLYVYNGEETLVRFTLDVEESMIKDPEYLIGCPELFKVEDLFVEGSQLIVGTDYGVVLY